MNVEFPIHTSIAGFLYWLKEGLAGRFFAWEGTELSWIGPDPVTLSESKAVIHLRLKDRATGQASTAGRLHVVATGRDRVHVSAESSTEDWFVEFLQRLRLAFPEVEAGLTGKPLPQATPSQPSTEAGSATSAPGNDREPAAVTPGPTRPGRPPGTRAFPDRESFLDLLRQVAAGLGKEGRHLTQREVADYCQTHECRACPDERRLRELSRDLGFRDWMEVNENLRT